MGAGNSVQFDPTVPPGSESLQNGPKRFYAIAGNILRLFGYPGTLAQTFDSPITSVFSPDTAPELLLANDPTQPMSAVTKQYADGRAMRITAVGGPTLYTFDLNDWSPTTNAIYEFSYTGTAYTGGAGLSISINSGTPIPIVKADSSNISDANDLLPDTIYPMAYDGTSFRILGFIGGTLTRTLTLATSTTLISSELEAVTKDYVDATGKNAINASQAIPFGVPVSGIKIPLVGGGAQLIIQWSSVAITNGTGVHGVGLTIPFPTTMVWAMANVYSSGSMNGLTGAWTGELLPQTVNVACNVPFASGVLTAHVIAIGV